MVADAAGYMSERAVGLVLTAVVGVLVARYLGPSNFGLLSFTSGVYGLLAPIALLGMPSVLVRDFSTQSEWRPILSSALTMQVPAAVFASVVGLALIVASRGFDREVVLLALVLLPMPLLGLSQTVRALLEASGQVRQVVLSGIAGAFIASLLRIFGLLLEGPVWVFGAIATFQGIVVLVLLLAAMPARAQVAALVRHVRRDVAGRLIRESWPLLVAAISVTLYMQADIIMLGIISGDRETGLYTSAARLSEVWYFIPVAALAAIRPRLARLYVSGEHAPYRALTQRFMTLSAGASLLAVVAVLVSADFVIRSLYGAEFAEAGTILRIHILAAPFVFLGVAGGQWFIDRGMTRAVMVRSAIGAVLNIVLNLALLPEYGAEGAAIATLVAYASGVLINVVPSATRPLFWMQARAFLPWPTEEVAGQPE